MNFVQSDPHQRAFPAVASICGAIQVDHGQITSIRNPPQAASCEERQDAGKRSFDGVSSNAQAQ
jgi:hypothetical protein